MVVVFDFRLGKGCLVRRAPEHRLQSFIDTAPLHNFPNSRMIVAS